MCQRKINLPDLRTVSVLDLKRTTTSTQISEWANDGYSHSFLNLMSVIHSELVLQREKLATSQTSLQSINALYTYSGSHLPSIWLSWSSCLNVHSQTQVWDCYVKLKASLNSSEMIASSAEKHLMKPNLQELMIEKQKLLDIIEAKDRSLDLLRKVCLRTNGQSSEYALQLISYVQLHTPLLTCKLTYMARAGR